LHAIFFVSVFVSPTLLRALEVLFKAATALSAIEVVPLLGFCCAFAFSGVAGLGALLLLAPDVTVRIYHRRIRHRAASVSRESDVGEEHKIKDKARTKLSYRFEQRYEKIKKFFYYKGKNCRKP
jgi:hypothetical protein